MVIKPADAPHSNLLGPQGMRTLIVYREVLPACGDEGAWEASLGEAKHTVVVSMQPGNNYRAGASCMDDGVTDANITQTEADVNVPTPPVVLTDMLTVWRKVWLELDSMANGVDISRSGAIDAIYDNNPHSGDGKFEFSVADIDDNARFEGGTASVPATGRVYTLIDNEDASGDDYYFTDGLIVGNDLNQIATVVDDDAFVLPYTPDADLGVLNDKYKPCYVDFVEHAAARDNTTTFIATLSWDIQ